MPSIEKKKIVKLVWCLCVCICKCVCLYLHVYQKLMLVFLNHFLRHNLSLNLNQELTNLTTVSDQHGPGTLRAQLSQSRDYSQVCKHTQLFM